MSEKFGLDKELAEKAAQKYDKNAEKEAVAWIKKLTGIEVGDNFFEGLKDGAILCTLINVIRPGACPHVVDHPKHFLESKANIEAYVKACKSIGLPAQDQITAMDFSERKKDVNQLLLHVFALSRQSQAIGYSGPILGARYYKSAEDQKRDEERRAQVRKQEREKRKKLDVQYRKHRKELEIEKSKRHSLKVEKAKLRLSSRIEKRKSRGRGLKKSESNRNIQELESSPSPIRYGMDAETKHRREAAYESVEVIEESVLDWVEDVTGEEVNHLYLSFKSGRLLCRLINCLRPYTIKEIHTRSMGLLERENIQKFLAGCEFLGVKKMDLFSVNDLYQQKDLASVVQTLVALSRCMENTKDYKGPTVNIPKGHRAKIIRRASLPDVEEAGGSANVNVASLSSKYESLDNDNMDRTKSEEVDERKQRPPPQPGKIGWFGFMWRWLWKIVLIGGLAYLMYSSRTLSGLPSWDVIPAVGTEPEI